MDMPDTEIEEIVDYLFPSFIYGFLALLAICVLFSLAKAIYHFYKVRTELNAENSEDDTNAESHSTSNEPVVLDRHVENNVRDSDRLRSQLDKLRRLLNRLNAMGTFSRDTIGNLSQQSAAYGNYSRAASSDLSAFWSSIDFDDCEDSTINEVKLQKLPTEKSISPSVSDFSLDASGINFDNLQHLTFATSSRENVLNVSAVKRQTNTSETIAQILTILDSIMSKNKLEGPFQNNKFQSERNSDEFRNIQASSRSVDTVKSNIMEERPCLSCSLSMAKKSSLCDLNNSSTLVNIPEYAMLEVEKSRCKSKPNLLTYNPKLLDQLLHVMQSHVSPVVSLDTKIRKGTSVINVSSDFESKNLYTTKSSSKSPNTKLSVSRTVGLCRNSGTCLFTQTKGNSVSDVLFRGSCFLKNKNFPQILTETHVSQNKGISDYICSIDNMNRSHSLSDLTKVKSTILTIPYTISKSSSCDNGTLMSNLKTEKFLQSAVAIKSSQNSQNDPAKEVKDDRVNMKSSDKIQRNNKTINSVSSKNLHSPSFSNGAILKLSLSESEVKPSQFLGVFTPNLSPAGSDAFLSPVIAAELSLSDKIDWKSPMEPSSDIYVTHNLTPQHENTSISRKSCIWSTPPSPKENVSGEFNTGEFIKK